MSTLTVIRELSFSNNEAIHYQIALFGKEAEAPTTIPTDFLDNKGLVLLFLNVSTEQPIGLEQTAILIEQIQLFLAQSVNQRVKFLWIENPLDSRYKWRTQTLSVQKIGAENIISDLTYFDIRNYTFSISKGCRIRLNIAQNAFLIQQVHNEAFELATAYGEHRMYGISEKMEGTGIDSESYSLKLPIDGTETGCLEFDLFVEKDGDNTHFSYPELTQLDIGFRIFMSDPNFIEEGDDFYLASHRYPFFDEICRNEAAFDFYPANLSFAVSLDPINPLQANRSKLVIQSVKTGDTTTPLETIPSGFRTNMGRTVHLVPTTESKFVFAERPILLEDTMPATLYLVPANDFAIRIPDYTDKNTFPNREENIICGISGVEFIKIEGRTPDASPAVMTFVPGQAAFASSHVSVAALIREFPFILKESTGFELVPNTSDQDAPIPKKREELTSRPEEMDYLEKIVRGYFPVGFSFTEEQGAAYNGLERIEELVSWLQHTLITAQLRDGALTNQATTSWVYIKQESNKSAVYYAQPEQAILYKAESSSIDFLDFLEIPSVGLPLTSGSKGIPLAFPMLPYGDVDPYTLTDLRLLEVSLINHFRRKRIQEISADTSHVTSLGALASTKPRGTTPQGLVATFSTDYKKIEQLNLCIYTSERAVESVAAADVETEPIPKLVSLANIEHGTPLKAAIQSNQLFMVISDPQSLVNNFKDTIVDTIDDLTKGVDATTALEIKKWIFELGTESWDKNNRNTILIFKFHDKPLLELAARTELWSFPDHFNTDPASVSSTLLSLLNEAVEIGNRKDPKESGKYEVLAQAATQANWTGVLALNAHVAPSGLPPELLALAAGIDPELFFAQYVGIELTRVTSTGTTLMQQGSSLFGLIDYVNPELPEAIGSVYDFQVASLTVVFENSRIKDFSAEILLLVKKLFGESCRLIGSRNNIISLIGASEEHNGKRTYSFGFKGSNRFKLSGNALKEVEIVKTQFVTDPITNLNANPLKIVGRFIFWGRIRFAYLSKFDILSFGKSPTASEEASDALSFNNLQIKMAFDLVKNVTTRPISTFTFEPNLMGFDLEKSGWRKQSLYEKFPLIFRGFLVGQADGALLKDFIEVNTPLKMVKLETGVDENGHAVPWYGMTFTINMEGSADLGTKATIKADILVGWNPGKPGLFVGLKFPGSSGTDRSLTIVGLLKLVFKSIRFVAYPINGTSTIEGAEREVGYLLNLKNIRLEFFKLFFPPIGKTEITLFGDPDPDVNRENRMVGWYGSYVKK